MTWGRSLPYGMDPSSPYALYLEFIAKANDIARDFNVLNSEEYDRRTFSRISNQAEALSKITQKLRSLLRTALGASYRPQESARGIARLFEMLGYCDGTLRQLQNLEYSHRSDQSTMDEKMFWGGRLRDRMVELQNSKWMWICDLEDISMFWQSYSQAPSIQEGEVFLHQHPIANAPYPVYNQPQPAVWRLPPVVSDSPLEHNNLTSTVHQELVNQIKSLRSEITELRSHQLSEREPSPSRLALDPILKRFLAAQELAQQEPTPSAISDSASTIVPPPYALSDVGAPTMESHSVEEFTEEREQLPTRAQGSAEDDIVMIDVDVLDDIEL